MKIDCIWTDPPYGVDYQGGVHGSRKKIANDAKHPGKLLREALNAAAPHCVDGVPTYVCCPPGPELLKMSEGWVEAGWKLHEILIWVKNAFVLGRSDYHLQHEAILYGWGPNPKGAGRMRGKNSRWFGDNAAASVFHVDRPTRSEEHPTMKPVDLITATVKNSVPPGGKVLDLFGGSGSTLVAAEELGFTAYIVELEPEYCDVIRERYKRVIEQTRMDL